MDDSQLVRWLKADALGSHRRMLQLLVIITCLIVMIGILYMHLVVWPQEFHEGQVVPYTVFSPVTFSYIDRTLVSEIAGPDGETAVQEAIDLSRKQEAIDRMRDFHDALLELRQHCLDTGFAGEAAETAIGEFADGFNIERVVVKDLLRHSDSQLSLIFTQAEKKLGVQMDGIVSDALVRQLKQQGAAHVIQSPEGIYVYFLAPNLVKYEPPDLTEDARKAATVTVAKGSVIIAEGQHVDARIASQLEQLKPYTQERQFLVLAGISLILLFAVLMWYLYLKRFAPRLISRPTISMQLGALLIMCLAAGLVTGRLPFNYFYYGVSFAVAVCAIIVVLAYDSQFAIYFALVLGLVLSMALGFGANLMLYTMGGALLPTVFLSAGARRRGQVLFALTQGLINVALAATVILISVQTLHLEVFAIAFTTGIGSAIVAFGLLPVVETLTSQLTPGKLVELANPENELLKRLKREAHGTFAHCIVVADLAEEACIAINADGLKARVGALYHDIGKLRRPGFFAENITDLSKNPHQGLPPETSVKILRDHVADGLNMAREHRLPKDLLPFIAEHHGTNLIKYFFAQAQKLHEDAPDTRPEPLYEEYNYVGPIPGSRETGVVMLADICEAMVRALGETDFETMRQAIAGVVSEKMADGQLVRSNLSLGDLEEIKKAFERVLQAIRHHRITYPGKMRSVIHFMQPDMQPVSTGKDAPE
jgi:putative nucleotidyltransferase with HDIG domain